MNIKIDKELFKSLLSNTRRTIQFGNIDGEDTDLLHILPCNKQMDISITDNNHILFYKDTDTNTDHLFVTERGFVQGIITGSCTLFYELLVEGKLEGSVLGYLIKYKADFITYKLLKGFIGQAERDLKQSSSHKNHLKKLYWATKYTNMVRVNIGLPEIDGDINKGTIKNTRKLLTDKYQQGEILFSIDEDVFKELQDYLSNFKTLDLPELNKVQSYYYDNWRE